MQLVPLPYHRRLATLLAAREPALFEWFGSDALASDHAREMRISLDKSALRLGRQDNPINERRYQLAERARDALGLSEPLALYQSLDTGGPPNAYLHYIPDQITITFEGRILELLDEQEMLDLLGHEIAHFKLYREDDGRHYTTVRALHWICGRDGCPQVWHETARRLSLHTEIYCDVAGLIVTGNRDVSIRCLAKIIADFKDADAKTYLTQVEAILSADPSRSKGRSHPELHIRAKALVNRAEMDDATFEASLTPLIEGALDIEAMDLPEQVLLEEITRALIDRFARQPACRTDAVQAQIRQFFPRYQWPGRAKAQPAIPALATTTRDYLAYLLLDLATADPERLDEGLALALVMAKSIGIGSTVARMARSELKRTADEVQRLEAQGEKLMEAGSNA